MTLPNPKFAPRRNDLTWLRRRRAPVAVAAPAPAKAAPVRPAPVTTPANPAPRKSTTPPPPPTTAAGPPHAAGGRIDYTRRDRTPTPTPAPRPSAPPVPASASGNSLDLSGPAPTSPPPRTPPAPAPASGGNSLDLSGLSPSPTPAPSRHGSAPAASGGALLYLSGPSAGPTAPPASTPPPTGSSSGSGGGLLDLSGPPAAGANPGGPPAASTSLDLTPSPSPSPGAGAGPTAGSPRRPTPPPAPTRHHVVRRTRPGATTLLQFDEPVVTLDRRQSGVGGLTIDAVVGDEVGDLRIGAAWALTDGSSGTVELDANRRHGPETRPVVWTQKEGRFERIAVDLRRTRSLARLLVYAFSPSKQQIAWGGTVVLTTYGGARVDAPIVSAPSPAVLALLSLYNVDGKFVVRAEMDPVAGTVRDTCRAFGYDRITWLDDRTPVG